MLLLHLALSVAYTLRHTDLKEQAFFLAFQLLTQQLLEHCTSDQQHLLVLQLLLLFYSTRHTLPFALYYLALANCTAGTPHHTVELCTLSCAALM